MKELLKKLAAFQQECPVILKDTTAKNYNYADLPAIFAVINPLLKKHDLMITQPLEYDQGLRFVRTLVHDMESGETLESRIDIPEVSFDYTNTKGESVSLMNDYQALGSGITYMRRYALSSVLGIVTDKDTDAQGSQVKKQTKSSAPEKPWLNPSIGNNVDPKWAEATRYLAGGGLIADIEKKYRISKDNKEKLMNESMILEDLPFDKNSNNEQIS